MCVLVTQPCPALCYPVNCSLAGSSVHRILQAGILEWVAIPFSRGSSWPRDWTWISCIASRFFTVWTTRESQVIIIFSHFIHFFFWGFWYFLLSDQSVFFLMAVYVILGIILHLKTIKKSFIFSLYTFSSLNYQELFFCSVMEKRSNIFSRLRANFTNNVYWIVYSLPNWLEIPSLLYSNDPRNYDFNLNSTLLLISWYVFLSFLAGQVFSFCYFYIFYLPQEL